LGTGVDTRLMAAFLPPHSYSATSCRTIVAPNACNSLKESNAMHSFAMHAFGAWIT